VSSIAEDVRATPTEPVAAPPAPEPIPTLTGDPTILGLPIFVAGSVALGLALVGYVPASAASSALPIIMAATGLGLLVSTLWAAALGQTMVACIFGLFAGFWWSYAVLVLGLTHGWFAIAAADVERSTNLFLISWAIVMGTLTLATVRLPVAFTAVIALVVLALVLLIVGTSNADTSITKAAGWVTLAFAALGIYLFLNAAATATGGRSLPLGRPLVR
jgi:uncharacterized protein